MARCNELTIFTEERRVVDGKEHRHRRLIDCNRRQRFRLIDVGNSLANLETIDTNHGTDIAGLDGFYFRTAQTFKDIQLLNFRFYHRTVTFAQHNFLAFAQLTTMNAAYSDTTYIFGEVQRCNQHLGSSFQYLRFRNIFDDSIQQCIDIFGRLLPVFRHPPLFSGTVDCREIQLFFGCIQAEHQVEHHFLHFRRTTVRLVYLINNYDRF